MYRRIYGKCFTFGHIVGNNKSLFPECTENRKRCIQHHPRIQRPVDILIGITNGNRTCSSCHTSTHTKYCKRYGNQQSNGLYQIILPLAIYRNIPWCPIQFINSITEHCCQYHQIPVRNKLIHEDRSQITPTLIAKFLKDTHGSTPSGKTEIHTVYQIRYQEKAIDYRKNPADNLIKGSILFPMKRQQKQ